MIVKQYKLLTPGPLTTTIGVKEEMLFDRCTWDQDYKDITEKIRKKLLELAGVTANEYTSVLMIGRSTFTVESVMRTALKKKDYELVITKGDYGELIVKIAKSIGLQDKRYSVAYNEYPDDVEGRCI